MKPEEFLELIGEVDEKFIEKSERSEISMKKKASWTWLRAGALAACVCLVAAVGFALWQRTQFAKSELITGFDVTSEPEGSTGIVTSTEECYAIPEPGTCRYTVEVKEAVKHYAGKDVLFLVRINMYNEEQTRLSAEESAAEYKRLFEDGYEFYETEAWTYKGKGEKEYYNVVLCALTEEQIENFDVKSKYGYFLSFVKNGDSSSIPVDESNIVTDFDTWYESENGTVNYVS